MQQKPMLHEYFASVPKFRYLRVRVTNKNDVQKKLRDY
jgi:hypothetical protein